MNADLMELLTATVSLKSLHRCSYHNLISNEIHMAIGTFIFLDFQCCFLYRFSLPYLSMALHKLLAFAKKNEVSLSCLLTFKVPSLWGKWKGISLE